MQALPDNRRLLPSPDTTRFVVVLCTPDWFQHDACRVASWLRSAADGRLRLCAFSKLLRAVPEMRFQMVCIRPPETIADLSEGLQFHRGVSLHRLLHAVAVLCALLRTNTTWSDSVGRNVAAARTRLMASGLAAERLAALPRARDVGYTDTGRGGFAERRASQEMRVQYGCAPRRAAAPTPSAAPCLPYAPCLSRSTIDAMSPHRCLALLRQYFSAVAYINTLFSQVRTSTSAPFAGYWRAWDMERSMCRQCSPIYPTVAVELGVNLARGPHVDQQSSRQEMLVTKVSWQGESPGKAHPAGGDRHSHTPSSFQLLGTNLCIAEPKGSSTSSLLFNGSITHGAESVLNPVDVAPSANSFDVASGDLSAHATSVMAELLERSGTVSLATWFPDSVAERYRACGGDARLRELAIHDNAAQWLANLLRREVGFEAASVVATAVLYAWEGTTWRRLVDRAMTASHCRNPGLHSVGGGSGAQPLGAGGVLRHWECLRILDCATAHRCFHRGFDGSVELSSACSSGLVYSGVSESDTCDCALTPIVRAVVAGWFGDSNGAVSVGTIRSQFGLPPAAPLTRKQIGEVDAVWNISRLIVGHAGKLTWFASPPTHGQVVLVLLETTHTRAAMPELCVDCWGGRSMQESSLGCNPPPTSCYPSGSAITTPNQYRSRCLQTFAIPHAVGDAPCQFTCQHTVVRLNPTNAAGSGAETLGGAAYSMVCSTECRDHDLTIDISSLVQRLHLQDLGIFDARQFVPHVRARALMVDILRLAYVSGLLPSWLMLHWVEFAPTIQEHSGSVVIPAFTPSAVPADTPVVEYAVVLRCGTSAHENGIAAHIAAAFPNHGMVHGSMQCTGRVRISIALAPPVSAGRTVPCPNLFEHLEAPHSQPAPRLRIQLVGQSCRHEFGRSIRNVGMAHLRARGADEPALNALPYLFLSVTGGNTFWTNKETIFDTQHESQFADIMSPWLLKGVEGLPPMSSHGARPSRYVMCIQMALIQAHALYHRSDESVAVACGDTYGSPLTVLHDQRCVGVNALFCVDHAIQALIVASRHPNVSTFSDALFGLIEPLHERQHGRPLPVAISSFSSSSPFQRGTPCLVAVLIHTDLGSIPQRFMWAQVLDRTTVIAKAMLGAEKVQGEHLVRVYGRHTSDLGAEQRQGWLDFFGRWVSSGCYSSLVAAGVPLPAPNVASWDEVKEVLLVWLCNQRRLGGQSSHRAVELLQRFAIFHFHDNYHAGRALQQQSLTIASRTCPASSLGFDKELPMPKRTKRALNSMHSGLRHLLGCLGRITRSTKTRDYRHLREYVADVADLLGDAHRIEISLSGDGGALQCIAHRSTNYVCPSTSTSSAATATQLLEMGLREDALGDLVEREQAPFPPETQELFSGNAELEDDHNGRRLCFFGPLPVMGSQLCAWVSWARPSEGAANSTLPGCAGNPVAQGCAQPSCSPIQRKWEPSVFLSPRWSGVHSTETPVSLHERPSFAIELPATLAYHHSGQTASLRIKAGSSVQQQQMGELRCYIQGHLLKRLAEQAHWCHWSSMNDAVDGGADDDGAITATVQDQEGNGPAAGDDAAGLLVAHNGNRRLAIASSMHETVNRCWRQKWISALPGEAVRRMERGTGINLEYFTTFLLGGGGHDGKHTGLLVQLATSHLLSLSALPSAFRGPTDVMATAAPEREGEPIASTGGGASDVDALAFNILRFDPEDVESERQLGAAFNAVAPLITYRRGPRCSSLSGRTTWARGDDIQSRTHLCRVLRLATLRIFCTAVLQAQDGGQPGHLTALLRVSNGVPCADLHACMQRMIEEIPFLKGAPASAFLTAKRLQKKLALEDAVEPTPQLTFMLDLVTVSITSGLAATSCMRAECNCAPLTSLRRLHSQACKAVQDVVPLAAGCCSAKHCGFFCKPSTPVEVRSSGQCPADIGADAGTEAGTPLAQGPLSELLTKAYEHCRVGSRLALRPGQHDTIATLQRGGCVLATLPCGSGKTFTSILHTMLLLYEQSKGGNGGQKRLVLLSGPISVALQRLVQSAREMGIAAICTVDEPNAAQHLTTTSVGVEPLLVCFTPEKVHHDRVFQTAVEQACSSNRVAAWYLDEADTLLQEFRGNASTTLLKLAGQASRSGTALCLMSGTMSQSTKEGLLARLSTPATVTNICDPAYTRCLLSRVNWAVLPLKPPGGPASASKLRLKAGDPMHPGFTQIAHLVAPYAKRGERVIVYASTYAACNEVARHLDLLGVAQVECHNGKSYRHEPINCTDAVDTFCGDVHSGPWVLISTNQKLARALDSGDAIISAIVDACGLDSLDTLVQHAMRLSVCRQMTASTGTGVVRGDHFLLYDTHDVVDLLRRKEYEASHQLRSYAELHSGCRIRFLCEHLGLVLDSAASWCLKSNPCRVCSQHTSDAAGGTGLQLECVTVVAKSVVEYATLPGVSATNHMMQDVLLGSGSMDLKRRLPTAANQSCHGALKLRTPKRTSRPTGGAGVAGFEGRVATNLAGELISKLLSIGALALRGVEGSHGTQYYLTAGKNTQDLLDGHMVVELTMGSMDSVGSSAKKTVRARRHQGGGCATKDLMDFRCFSFPIGKLIAWRDLSARRATAAVVPTPPVWSKKGEFFETDHRRIDTEQLLRREGYRSVHLPTPKRIVTGLVDVSSSATGVAITLMRSSTDRCKVGLEQEEQRSQLPCWVLSAANPESRKAKAAAQSLARLMREHLQLHRIELMDRLNGLVDDEYVAQISAMEAELAHLDELREAAHKTGDGMMTDTLSTAMSKIMDELTERRENTWCVALSQFGSSPATHVIEMELLTMLTGHPVRVFEHDGAWTHHNIGGLLGSTNGREPLKLVRFACGTVRAIQLVEKEVVAISAGTGESAVEVEAEGACDVGTGTGTAPRTVFTGWAKATSMNGRILPVVMSPQTFLAMSTECDTLELGAEKRNAFAAGVPAPALEIRKGMAGKDATGEGTDVVAYVANHDGRHRARWVADLGFTHMLVHLCCHRTEDMLTKIHAQSAIEYKEGVPYRTSSTPVCCRLAKAKMEESDGQAGEQARRDGWVAFLADGHHNDECIYRCPSPEACRASIQVSAAAIGESTGPCSTSDGLGQGCLGLASPAPSIVSDPPSANGRWHSLLSPLATQAWATADGGSVVLPSSCLWGEYTSPVVPLPPFDVHYALHILSTVRPTVVVYAAPDGPSWDVRMEHLHNLRVPHNDIPYRWPPPPVTHRQCKEPTRVIECCIGRRVMNFWAHLLEDTYGHVNVFGGNELGAAAGLHAVATSPDAQKAAVMGIVDRLEVSRRLHLFALHTPSIAGDAPGSDVGGLEGTPDGHWAMVAVTLSPVRSQKPAPSRVTFWCSEYESSDPTSPSIERNSEELLEALRETLCRVYSVWRGVDTVVSKPECRPCHNGKSGTCSGGAWRTALRYQCGTFVCIGMMCLCRDVDPAINDADIGQNHMRLFILLCAVAGTVLKSIDGWCTARLKDVSKSPVAPSKQLISKHVKKRAKVSPLSLAAGVNAATLSPLASSCKHSRVRTGPLDLGMVYEAVSWIECTRCGKWRKVSAATCTAFRNVEWSCSLNVDDPAHNDCHVAEEDSVVAEAASYTEADVSMQEMNGGMMPAASPGEAQGQLLPVPADKLVAGKPADGGCGDPSASGAAPADGLVTIEGGAAAPIAAATSPALYYVRTAEKRAKFINYLSGMRIGGSIGEMKGPAQPMDGRPPKARFKASHSLGDLQQSTGVQPGMRYRDLGEGQGGCRYEQPERASVQATPEDCQPHKRGRVDYPVVCASIGVSNVRTPTSLPRLEVRVAHRKGGMLRGWSGPLLAHPIGYKYNTPSSMVDQVSRLDHFCLSNGVSVHKSRVGGVGGRTSVRITFSSPAKTGMGILEAEGVLCEVTGWYILDGRPAKEGMQQMCRIATAVLANHVESWITEGLLRPPHLQLNVVWLRHGSWMDINRGRVLFEHIEAFDISDTNEVVARVLGAVANRCPIGASVDEEGTPTSFFQLCVVFDAGVPTVIMDFWHGADPIVGGAARWIHHLAAHLLQLNPVLEVATWSYDPSATLIFGLESVVDLQADCSFTHLIRMDLGAHAQGPLGLKRAFAWYLARQGLPSPRYHRQTERYPHSHHGIHDGDQRCWRDRCHLTHLHIEYAANDPYTTAMLLLERRVAGLGAVPAQMNAPAHMPWDKATWSAGQLLAGGWALFNPPDASKPVCAIYALLVATLDWQWVCSHNKLGHVWRASLELSSDLACERVDHPTGEDKTLVEGVPAGSATHPISLELFSVLARALSLDVTLACTEPSRGTLVTSLKLPNVGKSTLVDHVRGIALKVVARVAPEMVDPETRDWRRQKKITGASMLCRATVTRGLFHVVLICPPPGCKHNLSDICIQLSEATPCMRFGMEESGAVDTSPQQLAVLFDSLSTGCDAVDRSRQVDVATWLLHHVRASTGAEALLGLGVARARGREQRLAVHVASALDYLNKTLAAAASSGMPSAVLRKKLCSCLHRSGTCRQCHLRKLARSVHEVSLLLHLPSATDGWTEDLMKQVDATVPDCISSLCAREITSQVGQPTVPSPGVPSPGGSDGDVGRIERSIKVRSVCALEVLLKLFSDAIGRRSSLSSSGVDYKQRCLLARALGWLCWTLGGHDAKSVGAPGRPVWANSLEVRSGVQQMLTSKGNHCNLILAYLVHITTELDLSLTGYDEVFSHIMPSPTEIVRTAQWCHHAIVALQMQTGQRPSSRVGSDSACGEGVSGPTSVSEQKGSEELLPVAGTKRAMRYPGAGFSVGGSSDGGAPDADVHRDRSNVYIVDPCARSYIKDLRAGWCNEDPDNTLCVGYLDGPLCGINGTRWETALSRASAAQFLIIQLPVLNTARLRSADEPDGCSSILGAVSAHSTPSHADEHSGDVLALLAENLCIRRSVMLAILAAKHGAEVLLIGGACADHCPYGEFSKWKLAQSAKASSTMWSPFSSVYQTSPLVALTRALSMNHVQIDTHHLKAETNGALAASPRWQEFGTTSVMSKAVHQYIGDWQKWSRPCESGWTHGPTGGDGSKQNQELGVLLQYEAMRSRLQAVIVQTTRTVVIERMAGRPLLVRRPLDEIRRSLQRIPSHMYASTCGDQTCIDGYLSGMR